MTVLPTAMIATSPVKPTLKMARPLATWPTITVSVRVMGIEPEEWLTRPICVGYDAGPYD